MNDHELCELLITLEPRPLRIAGQYLSCYADRQDAVQECFFKTWKYRESIQEPKYIRTWVIRILINECMDIQRKRIMICKHNYFEGREQESEDELNHVVDKIDLERAFSMMNEVEKQILYLRYYKVYMLPEIADMMKLPMGTVQSRLYRSLKRLSFHMMAG